MEKCNYIEIVNLKKAYKKNIVFENLSYKFEAGKIYVIMGKNGSGKTTLLKALLDYIPYYGVINRNNNSIVGLLEESKGYYYLTALEQLIYFLGNEKIGLIKEIAKKLFFEDDLNKKFNSLSLGMKQKVALIYCFASDADFILLDEPTNSLDVQACKALKELIDEKNKEGKTVIITSHDMFFVNELDAINLVISNESLTKSEVYGVYVFIKVYAENPDFEAFLNEKNIKYKKNNKEYLFDCKNEFIHMLIDIKEQYKITNIMFDQGDLKYA